MHVAKATNSAHHQKKVHCDSYHRWWCLGIIESVPIGEPITWIDSHLWRKMAYVTQDNLLTTSSMNTFTRGVECVLGRCILMMLQVRWNITLGDIVVHIIGWILHLLWGTCLWLSTWSYACHLAEQKPVGFVSDIDKLTMFFALSCPENLSMAAPRMLVLLCCCFLR